MTFCHEIPCSKKIIVMTEVFLFIENQAQNYKTVVLLLLCVGHSSCNFDLQSFTFWQKDAR